MVIKAVYMTIM